MIRSEVHREANQLQAAHPGHIEVGDDEVELLALDHVQGLLAIGGGQAATADLFKGVGDHVHDGWIVIHDQDIILPLKHVNQSVVAFLKTSRTFSTNSSERKGF